MRLLVVGASGGTGRLVVSQALERGDEVHAFVRRPGALPTHTRMLEIVGTLPADRDALVQAARGQDAVISTIGVGKSFTPMTALQPFRQRGVASWYGKRYHGQKTSSGEVYDMYAMTAAHPTLPIPSYARVTHAGNGKSVVVRINDRGPFHAGRVIDLSYVAAYKLGFVQAGSAEVVVESIVR